MPEITIKFLSHHFGASNKHLSDAPVQLFEKKIIDIDMMCALSKYQTNQINRA